MEAVVCVCMCVLCVLRDEEMKTALIFLSEGMCNWIEFEDEFLSFGKIRQLDLRGKRYTEEREPFIRNSSV